MERVLAELEAGNPGSFPHFLANHVWLRDGGGTKLEPWPWQMEFAEALPSIKRGITLKARQLGMSWLFAAYALHTSFERGAEILLLSQTEKDAKKLLAKVKFIYRRLPEPMRPRTGVNNQSTLEFPDLESVIEALPSTENAGRGSTARLVICDEHAFHQWAEENQAAVDPAIDAGGQLFSLSTANGIGNLFADQWTKATNKLHHLEPQRGADGEWTFGEQLRMAQPPEGGWLPIFLPYDVRPGRSPEWWAQKKETFTRVWKIHQEYPRDPEESFVQTGRPVFDKEYLDGHKALCRDPLEPELWPETFAGWKPDELRIWDPPKPGHRYVSGADVAEGLEHGDYGDLTVWDVDAGEKPVEVLTLHGHWPPDIYGRKLDAIARLYPGVHGIERNNHGLAVILTCRALGTPGLFEELPVIAPDGQEVRPGKTGWTTSPVTKPLMIDELEQALRLFHIELRDRLAIPELTFYQTLADGKTGAPSGQWDDRVMSRALAQQMLKHVGANLSSWFSGLDGDE